MQPSPERNLGGDCFACAFTAIMQHLFPEDPPTFDECFEYFASQYADWYDEDNNVHPGNKFTNNTWTGFYTSAILHAIRDEEHDYPLEYFADLVVPLFDPEDRSYSFYNYLPTTSWARRLEAWLSAGWIAVAEIDSEGRGPIRLDGITNDINHFIIVDGMKYEWKSIDEKSKSLNYLIHVVCSSKGAYWVNCDDLLRKYGAAGLWLIRNNLNRP